MNPVLNTAFKAARRAGDMMVRASTNLTNVRVDEKTAADFLAEVRNTAEATVSDILREAYPHHKISSATQSSGPERSEYEWIIEPLDGVENYLHNHPQYAVSMALLHKGTLQEALVYAPERNDLYVATRGEGALLNDRRIRVPSRIELNRCIIGTGITAGNERGFAVLQDFCGKTAGVRYEGATSLDLCTLAAGRSDGFFQFGLQQWNIAAGALIIQEAGGLITDPAGNENWLQNGDLVAANPKVLAQMLQIIARR